MATEFENQSGVIHSGVTHSGVTHSMDYLAESNAILDKEIAAVEKNSRLSGRARKTLGLGFETASSIGDGGDEDGGDNGDGDEDGGAMDHAYETEDLKLFDLLPDIAPLFNAAEASSASQPDSSFPFSSSSAATSSSSSFAVSSSSPSNSFSSTTATTTVATTIATTVASSTTTSLTFVKTKGTYETSKSVMEGETNENYINNLNLQYSFSLYDGQRIGLSRLYQQRNNANSISASLQRKNDALRSTPKHNINKKQSILKEAGMALPHPLGFHPATSHKPKFRRKTSQSDALVSSLASVDVSAKLLEEKLQLLTLQVAEEFRGTEQQMRARAAALGIAAAAPASSISTAVSAATPSAAAAMGPSEKKES